MVSYQTERKIHLFVSIIATLCIATFFTSTLLVELFGSPEQIATVKSLIVIPGLFILVPAIATTGGTGFALSKHKRGSLVDSKKKRMPIIGANGLLILLPAAILLDQWASAGSFDTKFYVVQAFELVAGAVNLTLMSMNIRAGFVMSGKLSQVREEQKPFSPSK
ncbi:MAG: hypothetical protein KZQ92_19305 [Candidatus Thiodiazotropha sp. (ex Lucinoma borealis)]|nr:hypothetical protein [Candidatus Thiodiazotropha sp. (ex Lucinoma borealis)]MCU7857956.1 hypothetical protein [Candidatus Thiodiazotropha sp. (ex Lucinoma borealis)]MCU7866115.1 hypothetical protein [Candidatus Thiodiazotropha sp. (ex Lucinoma borealis)]MCU7870068.1 hypothetical protein [Candidatus Thiodiazotropha sp. (ex Lucinoma borealis)]MCU7948054.1 hypothetical protein [Candidatus Thiodiazotropha sp. (ex Cardiolucina cf. quadrata)]